MTILPTRGFADPGEADQTGDVTERIKRNRQGDYKFKVAMLNARDSKREAVIVGVVKSPGTYHPKFYPAGPYPVRMMTSPAALCAEEGSPLHFDSK